MVVVFGSFVFEDDRTGKLFGIGFALAVLLDATIVRMLLVPATMELLGDKNWWMPAWLDRIIPKLNVEGSRHHAPTHPDHPPALQPELVGRMSPAQDPVEAMSDHDLLAMLQIIGGLGVRAESLDSTTVSRKLGWADARTAASLGEAKARLLVWGIRVGGIPAPRFEDIELTVQGRRLLAAAHPPTPAMGRGQVRGDRLMDTENVPPQVAMRHLIFGGWTSQALRAMVSLDLADHLARGPRSVDDLADAAEVDAAALRRLLAVLVAVGLCERTNGSTVALTPLGSLLRSDTEGSLTAVACLITAPWMHPSLGGPP